MARRRMRALTLLTVTFVLLAAAHAWQYPIGRPTADTLPGLGAGHGSETDSPYGTRDLQARQLRLLRLQHQKEVVADSARLVQLATELKTQTDQGVTATPRELKDVDEIAKLAKRLSEHMKNE